MAEEQMEKEFQQSMREEDQNQIGFQEDQAEEKAIQEEIEMKKNLSEILKRAILYYDLKVDQEVEMLFNRKKKLKENLIKKNLRARIS